MSAAPVCHSSDFKSPLTASKSLAAVPTALLGLPPASVASPDMACSISPLLPTTTLAALEKVSC